jgi:endonuclease/exonuclease/phosphatase family metal-dependent hydrolase
MIVFAVAAVAFYAAYDAGYPNWWVPPAAALPVAILAATGSAAPAAQRRTTRTPPRVAVPAALLVLALAAAGVWWAPPDERPPAPGTGDLRLVAYNIRMGFGLAGRYDPDALAAVIGAQRPDLVVLGEVDRAWLLNGGHDTLAALARRLGLRYLFGPAADQVWGDAVLTRLPVLAARSVALPAGGAGSARGGRGGTGVGEAPTGAQALGVRLDAGASRPIVVVATHLQPPPGGPPLAQARALIRFADEFRAGDPAVLAGDLNVRPGSETFEELVRAGYADALAAHRPLPTSPADAPREEIDHVLATAGIAGVAAVAPRGTDSDHLPVAVTLRVGG